MSDKQRVDHIQAKYWNGFLTRTEGQKVFDDFAKVIQAQAITLQKMDAVISFMAEKLGVTAADIELWIAKKVEEAAIRPNGPKADESKLVVA